MTADALDRGREPFGRWAWVDAFAELSAADRKAPLEPGDLERLATAAYLVGKDEKASSCGSGRIATSLTPVTSCAPPAARAGSCSSSSTAASSRAAVGGSRGRVVELEMTLVRIEPCRVVEYTSEQRGLPAARHWRVFDGAGGGVAYRIVVEYSPRTGWQHLFDRTLVRHAITRTARQTMANLDRQFREAAL